MYLGDKFRTRDGVEIYEYTSGWRKTPILERMEKWTYTLMGNKADDFAFWKESHLCWDMSFFLGPRWDNDALRGRKALIDSLRFTPGCGAYLS